MSQDETDDERDYKVGKGRPPKNTRFKKGQSGNPRGRPKSRNPSAIDVADILDRPVPARVGGRQVKMQPFEASFFQLAKKAIGGHLPSIRKFLKTCEKYRVIAPQTPKARSGVIVAPKGVDFDEWFESVTELVPVEET